MKINDDVIKVIIEQAKKDAPIESCGLLLGKYDVVTERFTSIPSRY
jgi:[CysO sulfur-carrier protein]-S-L-cysteine hydrolase